MGGCGGSFINAQCFGELWRQWCDDVGKSCARWEKCLGRLVPKVLLDVSAHVVLSCIFPLFVLRIRSNFGSALPAAASVPSRPGPAGLAVLRSKARVLVGVRAT